MLVSGVTGMNFNFVSPRTTADVIEGDALISASDDLHVVVGNVYTWNERTLRVICLSLLRFLLNF